MAFSSIRREVFKWDGNYSCIRQCLHPVRRISPGQRLFSAKCSKSSSSGLLDRDTVKERTAESVKDLLREYGFSDTQVSQLAERRPAIFRLRAKKNLEPKLKFLGSIGLSSAEIYSVVLRNIFMLSSSLEKQIIPSYHYLKNLPLPEEQIVRAARRYPAIFLTKWKCVLVPNIELLRSKGLPLSSITSLVVVYPTAICRNHETFKASFDQVIAMGLDPLKKIFIQALRVICSSTKENWERKMKLYKSFGLSEEEFLRAFRTQPYIMTLSEEKIVKTMEFFLNELQWTPTVFARYARVLTLDLEKRVIPRCRVMEILKGRGLTRKCSASTFLNLNEKDFFDRFIDKYKDELPELLDIFPQSRGNVSVHSD